MRRGRHRVLAGTAAVAMSFLMAASPVFAASTTYNGGIINQTDTPTGLHTDNWKTGFQNDVDYDIGKDPQISKDTIDRGMTGSITIYKLDEENGNTSEGDGMYHSATGDKYGENNVTTDNNVVVDANGQSTGENRGEMERDGIPNIIFSTAKIADIVNVAGHRTNSLTEAKDNPGLEDGQTDAEVGTYYGNLDKGFTEVAKKCGIDVNDYATQIDGVNYWSTEQMETLIEKIKDTNGDSNVWTGETVLNRYIEDAARKTGNKTAQGGITPTTKGKDFAATGSQLSDSEKKMYYDGEDTNRNQDKGKTVMTGMDLGLYVVAETGYYQYTGVDKNGNKTFEKVYRDYVYDDDGHEKLNTNVTKQKETNDTEESNDQGEKKVANNDQNYNDDKDVEGSLDKYDTDADSTKNAPKTKAGSKSTKDVTPNDGNGESRTNNKQPVRNPKTVDNQNQNATDIENSTVPQARNSKDQRYSTTTPQNNSDEKKSAEETPNYGSGTIDTTTGGTSEFKDAEDGTQNPYVIDTPCSPFLVSLPQTNAADLEKGGVTYKAGTVWQYDLNVYPKNNMTSISKKVVADDGDTLTERQDYHIGQNIHQVIYADSPVTMYTKNTSEGSNRTNDEAATSAVGTGKSDAHRNKEYKISDTMSKGLTFQRVTRVALRGRIANPKKLSQFDAQSTDAANYQKYDTDVELVPGTDYKVIYTLDTGKKYTGSIDSAQSTTTEDLQNEYTKNTSTAGKYYTDNDGNVPDYNLLDKSESSKTSGSKDVVPNIDPNTKTDKTKNHSTDGTNPDGVIGTSVHGSDLADAAAPNGDEYIQSFTVELLDEGLNKLDHQKVASQVIVEFDSVLNKNAVIGSEDGKTFNTNKPTLTWRNQSGLERKVEGNPVHIFTYELDLTKVGQSTKGTKDLNGNTVNDDHIFDAGDVSFSIQQEKQYDPDLSKNGKVTTTNAYMLFVQDRDANGDLIDGSYHVWTPADGAIEGIISADAERKTSNGTTKSNNEDETTANNKTETVKNNNSKDANETTIKSSKETAGSQDAADPSRDFDTDKDDKDNIRTGSGQSFDQKFAAAKRDPVTGLRTVDGVRYNSAKFPVTEVANMDQSAIISFSNKTTFKYPGTTTAQKNNKETDAVDVVRHEDFRGYGYVGDTTSHGTVQGSSFGHNGNTENSGNTEGTTEVNNNRNTFGLYEVTMGNKKVLATTDTTPTKTCVVTQLVSPAHTDTQIVNADDSSKDAANNKSNASRKEGLLKIRGLDSESYIVTEKSTSSHFNLLKNRFKVTMNSTAPKDGNLVKNPGGENANTAAANDILGKDLTQYGACLSMDSGTVLNPLVKVIPLSHAAGIVRITVENYKTITLHTGGYGTWFFYLIAAGLAGAAVTIVATKKHNKKKQEAA